MTVYRIFSNKNKKLQQSFMTLPDLSFEANIKYEECTSDEETRKLPNFYLVNLLYPDELDIFEDGNRSLKQAFFVREECITPKMVELFARMEKGDATIEETIIVVSLYFPDVLSNYLKPIYDKDIQSIYGWLCSQKKIYNFNLTYNMPTNKYIFHWPKATVIETTNITQCIIKNSFTIRMPKIYLTR